jgi:tetratricopeptide (TPR) repeat protein
LAHRQNDFEKAESLCRKSLVLFRDEDNQDQERVLNVLLNLGWIALCQSKLDEATQQLEESLALARKLKNQYCVAASLSYLAIVALLANQLEEALTLCQESVQICRNLGSNHYLGWALTASGAAALFSGEFEQARIYFLDGLQQLQEVGERVVMPNVCFHSTR